MQRQGIDDFINSDENNEVNLLTEAKSTIVTHIDDDKANDSDC